MDLFEKCAKAPEYESGLKRSGHYLFFRKLESTQDSESVVNGKKVIMIGSNNYLGLTNHPRVKEAAIKAIEKYGTGCAGSRFLNGNLEIHEELEKKLSRFFHTVVHEEPSQSIGPDEKCLTPAEGCHKQPINRYQRRHDLRAEHSNP